MNEEDYDLRIHLLGPFEVFRDGQPLGADDWHTQQTRTILKVLLIRRGHVVPADQLIELLWRDDDPEIARRRLHVRISQLRHALDPTSPADHILTVEDGYLFNPEADCWIDVDEFTAHADAGHNHQQNGNLAEAIAAYETARALYRGDLLEEDLYADWATASREHWRERFLTMLTELAECYAQQGRYHRAIACCQQVLTTDACREAVYLRLMLYYYYAGEQKQALRAYEQCCQILADELGVAPLPATVTLAEQIRAGTLYAVEGAPRYPPPAYVGRLFQVPYSLGRVPFVGREREYAWLVEQWRARKTGILLIEGETGIGKSRLVNEFLGYAAAQGVTVLQSRAAPREELPYARVAEALLPLLEPKPSPDIPHDTIAALAAIFPQVRSGTVALPSLPDLPPQQARERLFAAVKSLIEMRAPGALLFVDDAHRVDSTSLDLLVHLASTLTIILTCRTEETPPDHPLRVAIRPLRREGRLASLTLEPLPPAAIASLIRQLAHDDLPALTDQVVNRTDGTPLLAIALLQHLFEEGALCVNADGRWSAADAGAVSLSPTAREIIESRLQRLRGDLRRVFDFAAVLRAGFDFVLLQHASQMAEDPLLDALDALVDAGLVIEPRTAGRGEFVLAHDRYAEVAYAMIPAARRRRLHRQVASAIEQTASDLDMVAPALAHHLEQAGDAAHAFNWLVRAGDAARARYAHAEALALYQRAITLGAGEVAPVWDRMGNIAHHLAHFADGVHFYEAALARWQALKETIQQVCAHYALAECHRELSQFDQAAEHARAGLEMITAHLDQPALIARGHIILSNALRSGQLAPMKTVRDHLERALELARPAQEWQLVGQATFWLGVVVVNSGDPVSALVYDQEALAQFRRAGDAGWEAITLNNLAYHALLTGQAELALQTAEEGLALARRIGSVNSQGWLLSTLGEAQTHLGYLEAAQATLEEGLTLVTRWGPARLRPGFLADLSRVAIARQEWSAALTYLEQALALALETAPQFIPQLRVLLARAYLAHGNLTRAQTEAEHAQESAKQKGQRRVEGQAWRVLGAIHAAAGRAAEAEAAFAHSLELLQALGDALESARTQAAWGRWLAKRGDERAGDLLDAARRTFERYRAVVDLHGMGV
jgi:DNA-binding SARP family transcriptional activator